MVLAEPDGGPRLACYSAAGFTADLLAADNGEVMLVTPDRLYS
ncbi:hypothetical protein [Nonomuraea sp. NPDC050643]